jgi:hypothetical protein
MCIANKAREQMRTGMHLDPTKMPHHVKGYPPNKDTFFKIW